MHWLRTNATRETRARIHAHACAHTHAESVAAAAPFALIWFDLLGVFSLSSLRLLDNDICRRELAFGQCACRWQRMLSFNLWRCEYGAFRNASLGSLAVVSDAQVLSECMCGEQCVCVCVYACAVVCCHSQRMFVMCCYVFEIRLDTT